MFSITSLQPRKAWPSLSMLICISANHNRFLSKKSIKNVSGEMEVKLCMQSNNTFTRLPQVLQEIFPNFLPLIFPDKTLIYDCVMSSYKCRVCDKLDPILGHSNIWFHKPQRMLYNDCTKENDKQKGEKCRLSHSTRRVIE